MIYCNKNNKKIWLIAVISSVVIIGAIIGAIIFIVFSLRNASSNNKIKKETSVENFKILDDKNGKEVAKELRKLLNSPQYVEGSKKASEFILGNKENLLLPIIFDSPKIEGFIIRLTSFGQKQEHIRQSLFNEEDWKEIVILIREKNNERELNEEKKSEEFWKAVKRLDLDVFQGKDKKGWILFLSYKNGVPCFTKINPNHIVIKDFSEKNSNLIFKIQTGVPIKEENHNQMKVFFREIDIEDKVSIENYQEDFWL